MKFFYALCTLVIVLMATLALDEANAGNTPRTILYSSMCIVFTLVMIVMILLEILEVLEKLAKQDQKVMKK